jgi:asparagine synthase (glutamine-hydrolysing)
MMRFVLNLSADQWRQVSADVDSHLLLKGQAYLNGCEANAATLAAHLMQAESSAALKESLSHLNGFYAWIIESKQSLRAGVDHIRSRPLFYGQHDGAFFLSDDAEWVRQQVGDREMDPIAREEFQLAGYVTGPDTLFPNVKQLQAGEYLIATRAEAGIVVQTRRYYRFLHTEPATYDENLLRDDLDRVTVKVIQRLINYANGRQIVVPLSGGYDSRLIVTLLKRLEYQNVMTFSYGLPDNKEAIFSQKVANATGFPWVFIEYSNSLWAKAWSTPEAKAYRDMAANHVSLPHVQDWLALKILLERKVIPSNAILVPGHTGDFISGGHIPPIVFKKHRHSFSSITGSIIDSHLANAPNKAFAFCKGDFLQKRLSDRIDFSFDGSDISFANLVELWDWQERQSKYIMNSVRVYDYNGLDWWTPFWDIEFMGFWEKAPLELRRERHWFISWIKEQYAKYAEPESAEPSLSNASEELTRFKFARRILSALPSAVEKSVRKIAATLRKHIRLEMYKEHFLGFGGLVPRDKLKNYLNHNYNIIGIYSDLYLKDQWDDIRGW